MDATSTSTQSTASPALEKFQLPEELRNATAVVEVDNTQVYILGVSHVSKVALKHIRQLMETVKPDTIIVELCKDRTGLLIDENAPPPQCWHAPKISIVGYRPKAGWPTASELTQRLKSSNSSPVAASEIEDDAVALLSTGLFGSVRPVAKPPTRNGAPSFVMGPSGKLSLVAPLSEIEYVVTERKLPSIADFQIEFIGIDDSTVISEEILKKIKADVLFSGSGSGALPALLNARAALLKALEATNTTQENIQISFNGVETGKIVAKVAFNAEYKNITGLENTVVNGQGVGILGFRRQARQQVQPSASTGLKIKAIDDSKGNNPSSQSSSSSALVVIEPWTDDQLAIGTTTASSTQPGSNVGGIADAFAGVLTQQYAKYQAAAGRTVGIGTGAAWQVALQSAAECGATQVFLGDRPASVTGIRLAQGIWGSSAPFLLGALPAAIAGAIITSSATSDALQGSPAAFAAPAVAILIPLVAAVLPIVAPLLEIQKFSKLSASEIEETVKIKEPLQTENANTAGPYFLWGEDALIKWPGAIDSIINERDVYMSRAISAAVLGKAPGLTPAFVRTETSQGDIYYRYAMPKGGDPGVCPVGDGDGQFEVAVPESGTYGKRKILAVVGTAHVRGMLKAWPSVGKNNADLSLNGFL